MIRAILLIFFSVVLVALCPTVRAASPEHALLLAQLPPPPGWPGPAPGPEWLAHEEHCERLQRRLAHLKHRIHRSPPWVRQELAPEAAALGDRLRDECWGP